jgi:beta-galactosidase GanA
LIPKGTLVVLLSGFLSCAVVARASELPRISKSGDSGQLIVDGKPYLILGGELGNSSAGTAAQADNILPRLAAMHVNTVLMPVAWEQVEPSEGAFDFSILDHWIDNAREQHLHLVLLWFGSWKNSVSSYVPAWMKQDPERFPRAETADGDDLEILSTLSTETLHADSAAFSALMKHLKEKDGNQQTVLMVQVENEVGYLGIGRDRSETANRLFEGPVPPQLMQELQKNRDLLSPELRAHFNPAGKTWSTAFGDVSDEVFMTWNYARFIQTVAEAGKREYPLPMYVNCQLPAPGERAGQYPSGGPHPYYLEVYRVTAPSLDFYSPDIYWPNFEYWIDRYRFNGNAVFVPEARMDSAPYNALYAYGEAKAFGFSPFGIESVQASPDSESASAGIGDVYEVLSELSDVLLPGQASGDVRALVLHKDSPRPTRTVALGGYLLDAALSRTWPARTLATDDGAMIAIQSKPNEFYIAGSGLTISFARDPDTDNKLSGIASIEEVSRDANGGWITQRWLNGDQNNQGRQLSMDPHRMRIYHVKLYAVDRPASGR